MIHKTKVNRTFEEALMDFAKRCGLEDVRSFADVFLSARVHGGELMKIIARTAEIIGEKIREVENAMDMGFWLGLIELFQFGHNKRATRLLRLQKYVRDILNEAYGVDCVNANGQIEYDGCGLYRLKNRLKNYGIEYVDETGDK